MRPDALHVPLPLPQGCYNGEQAWANTGPNYPLDSLAPTNAGPLSRRHRSMTPHQPISQTFSGNQWLRGLFRRVTTIMLGSHLMEEPYRRATSLDPSTLNTRMAPFSHVSNDHSTGLNSFARLPIMSSSLGMSDVQQPFPEHSTDLSTLDPSMNYSTSDSGLRSAGQKTDLTDEYTNWN